MDREFGIASARACFTDLLTTDYPGMVYDQMLDIFKGAGATFKDLDATGICCEREMQYVAIKRRDERHLELAGKESELLAKGVSLHSVGTLIKYHLNCAESLVANHPMTGGRTAGDLRKVIDQRMRLAGLSCAGLTPHGTVLG